MRYHSGLRPMLAATWTPDTHLVWPMLASPKLDGIRALVRGGVVLSRSLKPIRNAWVQRTFGQPEYEGLDGELITSNQSFRDTTSAVMTAGSEERVNYCVFDLWNQDGRFQTRQERLRDIVSRATEETGRGYILALPHKWCGSLEYMKRAEEEALASGYEGIILRSVDGLYKYGRSTLREQGMLKVKCFQDAEATIVGAAELMRNLNELTTDERGYAKRSHSLDGKIPADMLGALIVKSAQGVQFEIGSGFDTASRIMLWRQFQAGKLTGQIVKYKFQPYGGYDLPRQPIFLGIRAASDL